MNIYLLLFLLFIGSPISILIHELGHAIAAILLRANKVVITIGTGRKLLAFRFKTLTIICNGFYFIGGVTEYKRLKHFTSKNLIWLTISGPLFNAMTAYILFVLFILFPNPYLHILCWFNVWLAVANLLPLRIKNKQTDGYTILQNIKRSD